MMLTNNVKLRLIGKRKVPQNATHLRLFLNWAPRVNGHRFQCWVEKSSFHAPWCLNGVERFLCSFSGFRGALGPMEMVRWPWKRVRACTGLTLHAELVLRVARRLQSSTEIMQLVFTLTLTLTRNIVGGQTDPFGAPMANTNNVYGCSPATSGDGIV